MFDESGQVTDPNALLRSMNFAAVSEDPFLKRGEDRYRYGNDPLSQWLKGLGNEGRNSPSLSGYAGNRSGLAEPMMRTTGPARAYDPSALRHRDFEVAPGLDIRTATLDQLNAWAQENFGVDLLDYAASTPQLNETRMEWLNNPNLWFDERTPGEMAVSKIPGMSAADSALRQAQYNDAYQKFEAQSVGDPTMANLRALMANPQLQRTGYGAMSGMVQPLQQQLQSYLQGTQPASPDYSFLYQYGMLPQQLSLAKRQLQGQM